MDDTRLAELREELNLKKKDIAEKLKVSPSIYGRWESFKASIPTERLYQLSNFYRVSLDYILYLIDEKVTMESAEEIDMELVSKRIREIRDDMGEPLRIFSKRFNTTNSTWNAYETGKVLILGDFLLELCKKYNYSADWILGRTNKKFNNQAP